MDANYDPWSTHLPALATAVHLYGGNVLEIGCGWYSTPLLYAMSKNVLTIETDPVWAKKFESITKDHLLLVDNLVETIEDLVGQWNVIFVDCEGNDLRRRCVELFINSKCCIVAHDTQEAHYQTLVRKVKYQRHYDFIMPRTSHLSNVLDVRAT